MSNYKQEQSEILKSLIYNDIYPNITSGEFRLELFITTYCNKNCSYCYLQKNKELLYPKEIQNPDTILSNLKILFNHLIEKKVNIYTLDLFSGDIWQLDFGKSILLTILQYLNKGLNINTIVIPTNGSFLNNQNDFFFYQDLINKFKEKNTRLCFSFSNDGLIIDKLNRPFNLQEYECDYNDLFHFVKLTNCAYHPMISAYGIEQQIDNLYWWESQFEKYNLHIGRDIMFLEVRSDEWTNEKIYHYLKWLKAFSDLIYTSPRYFNNNTLSFVKNLIDYDSISERETFFSSYTPLGLYHCLPCMSCNISQAYCVRLGDLSICPCHRTAYPHLLYGQYVVKDNKIVDIQNNNYYYALINWVGGHNNYIKCGSCFIRNYCIKGCQGAQYEHFKEPLYPLEDNCKLQKIKHLFNIYNYLYYLKQLDKKEWLQEFEFQLIICEETIDLFKIKEKELYQEWMPIIEKMFIEK